MSNYVPFAFVADVHGNAPWLEYVLPMLASANHHAVYQLGDFGLWQGDIGDEYIERVGKIANDARIKLRVILGNHEDYDQVETMIPDEDGWLKLPNKPIAKNIFFAPRGHTWVDNGYTFAALGGAGTIDRQMRTPGWNWWPGEEITEADRDLTISNIKKRNWKQLHFLLTHEAPIESVIASIYPKLRDLSPEVEDYCRRQRYLISDVIRETKPMMNVHGHHHRSSLHTIKWDNGSTVVKGLAHEGSVENVWAPVVSDLLAMKSSLV